MDSTLTLDMIFNLPNEILDTSKKYKEMSEMLSISICNKYDTKELTGKINNMFVIFKNVKYFYNFSVESSIKITPTYQLSEGSRQRSNASQVESIVTREVDSIIWATKFYDTVIFAAKKLTEEEATYLVNSLIKNKSESAIADILGVCTKTVHHIKKSCLIKIWSELEPLENENNI